MDELNNLRECSMKTVNALFDSIDMAINADDLNPSVVTELTCRLTSQLVDAVKIARKKINQQNENDFI